MRWIQRWKYNRSGIDRNLTSWILETNDTHEIPLSSHIARTAFWYCNSTWVEFRQPNDTLGNGRPSMRHRGDGGRRVQTGRNAITPKCCTWVSLRSRCLVSSFWRHRIAGLPHNLPWYASRCLYTHWMGCLQSGIDTLWHPMCIVCFEWCLTQQTPRLAMTVSLMTWLEFSQYDDLYYVIYHVIIYIYLVS